jgi:hypothetical protein
MLPVVRTSARAFRLGRMRRSLPARRQPTGADAGLCPPVTATSPPSRRPKVRRPPSGHHRPARPRFPPPPGPSSPPPPSRPSSPPKGTFATGISVANVPFGGEVGGERRLAAQPGGCGRSAGWLGPLSRAAVAAQPSGRGRAARWLRPLSRVAMAAVRSAVPAVIRPAGPGRRGLSAAAAVMKPILCARTAGTTEQPASGRTRRLMTTGTAERAPTPSSPPKGTFATELSVANVPFGGVVGRGRLRRATVTAGGGRPPRRQGVRVRSGVRSGPGAGR